MDKRLFISYSHKDSEWAKEIVEQLETLGFKVWKDNKYETTKENIESGIPAGSDWPKEIEHAICRCIGFIGLVSDNSMKSDWCYKELLYAEQQKGHVNILIRYREDTLIPEGLNYVYANNSNIVWSEASSPSVWKSIKANKAFWALRETNAVIDEMQSPMVKKINDHLIIDIKGHQSFWLMKALDKDLLSEEPAGNVSLIRNKERMVLDENGEKKVFGDYMKDSWESQKHLFIEGVGGVGKTVALLTLATEDSFLPVNTAAVYIPLYRLAGDKFSGDIDKYLKNKYSSDEYDWIEKYSKREWNDHPNLILLLDGYNEIPANSRSNVDMSIDDWSKRIGVQVITTSRFNATFNSRLFNKIQLLELGKQAFEDYLGKNGVSLLEPSNKIREVISIPLMLRIYVDVQRVKRAANKTYLPFTESVNAGSLIWNYLLNETNRCLEQTGSFDEMEYASGLLLVTPYIAWWMEKNNRFEITDIEFENLVKEASDYWNTREKPDYFKRMHGIRRWQINDIIPYNELCILEEETGMFWRYTEGKKNKVNSEEYHYVLLHQNFRDGLAAVHLNNIVESSSRVLPDEYKESLSEYVVDYLSNIINEQTFLNVWKTNRIDAQQNVVAANNLVRIFFKKHDGDLSGLNWTGMDLRGFNFYNFKSKSMRLMLSTAACNFEGTNLSIDCFEPQGHKSTVICCSFSPDGNKIASGSSDRTIRIWDAKTHMQIGSALIGHKDTITSFSFNSDGSLIVSGSWDHTIRIWDGITHKQIGEPLEGHTSIVKSVCFSPDGSKIISGSMDNTIRIWDVETHKQIGAPIEGHNHWVNSVCFGSDGNTIISGSSDTTIRIWDMETCEQIGIPLEGHTDQVCFVHAYGNMIASCSADNTIRIWNAETHRQIGIPLKGHKSIVNSVCFSPDGSKLVSGAGDGTIRIWDVDTRRQIGLILKDRADEVRSVCFSPDGNKIASGSSDRKLCIWDAFTHNQIGTALEGHMGRCNCVHFSPEGRKIVSGSLDGAIRIWDSLNHQQLGAVINAHTDEVNCVCFNPDGTMIASCSDDKTIRIWDAESHKQIGEPMKGHTHWVRYVVFSPDGKILASGSRDKTIRIWNVETHEQIGTPLKGHSEYVRSIGFSPDGKKLVSGSQDRTIRIWDLNKFQQIDSALKGHTKQINSVCFSPDGKMVVSGSDDKTIRIWDAESHQQIGEPIRGHTGSVRCVNFSQHGNKLVSGSEDGTIRIWDVITHEQIREPLQGHTDWVNSVSFMFETTKNVSVSDDGTIRIWDIVTHECHKVIQPLFGIDISGLDFSLAEIDKHSKEIIRMNGGKIRE